MSFKTLKERFISILTLCYMIPAGIILMFNTLFSLSQTTYMELYQDTEKPLYKADSPVLLLLLAVLFIGLAKFLYQKCQINDKLCRSFEKTALIFSAVLCMLIIFIYRVHVACDSESLSEIAIAFLKDDYSGFSGDSYLAHYPHQLGMIAFLEIIYFIFGINNFTVLQFINMIAIFSVIFFLHRITEKLFHDLKIRMMLSLLCIGMLPLYLYVTFIYGDVPGMGFAAPAIYYVIQYHANRYVCHKGIHAGQRSSRDLRTVHRSDSIHPFQICHQRRLHGNITQINLIACRIRQRIFRKPICIFPKIFFLKALPSFIRRNKDLFGHFHPLVDQHANLRYLFFAYPFVKKDRNADPFLGCFYNVLKIGKDGVKQAKQKQAGPNRGYRSQGKPFIPENIDKPLSECVKKRTNPHRYNHLFPHRLL